MLSVVKGALRGVHGREKVQEEVSGYLLADEVSKVYEGMMMATGEEVVIGIGKGNRIGIKRETPAGEG